MISKKILFVAIATIIGSFFLSCSFTKTKSIVPKFKLTLDSISRDINSLVYTPEANITGNEISVDGHVRSELRIDLINSHNLPKDEQEMKKLSENVAILIKNSLVDPESFTDYQVFFTKKSKTGALTKTDYVSYSYRAKDLKDYIQIVSLGNRFDSKKMDAVGSNIFTMNDSEIVCVFTYYNNVPGSPVKLNIYKNTDSGFLIIKTEELGQILPGNNFLGNNLRVNDFYQKKELGKGNYQIEYVVSDTSVGSRAFTLE